jgi:hypothetical protein
VSSANLVLTNAGWPRAARHALSSMLMKTGEPSTGSNSDGASAGVISSTRSGVRISSHRAKPGTLLSQLIDNVTPDVSRGAGDEDAVH